ncbi:MAG: uracil-DNA glycosylase [Planctomycetaceae bacterium]|nr:uracil-DNA glycosylase [Planctomycetaceae bacterium]
MPINRLLAQAVKGLQARLELEEGLGSRYITVSRHLPNAVTSLRETLESPDPAVQMPAIRSRRADPGRPAVTAAGTPDRERGTPTGTALLRQGASSASADASPGPVPKPLPDPGDRHAPPSRPVPPGYVSLVPYRPEPAQPEREAALAALRDECLHCTRCDLCAKRTNVAWGEGNLAAEVMFIGEGPGKDEDIEGRPFVGRSGRLLTDIIEKAMKVPRPEVYITNVVKCRPPGNRDPRPDEVAACSRYLDRQIEVIAPKILVAVGAVAGRSLLGLAPGASGLRGRWHDYNGTPLRVVYHPSYLLRMRRSESDRTSADRQMYEDILEVLSRLQAAR